MGTAAICFATHDAAFAAELASYLGLHTSLCPELAECSGHSEFLDLIEQCLTHQFVIVIMSPAAVPTLWPRDLWERVLVECARDSGSQLAYVMREMCPLPQILKRRSFFDFTSNSEDARQALRQWVIQGLRPDRHAPGVAAGTKDELLLPLLDQPGLMRQVDRRGAEWLVSNYWRCFENVYWVECGSWARAAVLGELAQVMNQRLPGTVDQNLFCLRNHAQQERALYVFQYLSEEFSDLAELGGKASVLILADEDVPEAVTLQQLTDMFFAPSADSAACLRALGRFIASEQNPESWAELKSVGLRAQLLFNDADRFAEAHELLVWLAIHAQRNADKRGLEQIQREENWILNAWDLPPLERAGMAIRTQPTQLPLPFGS